MINFYLFVANGAENLIETIEENRNEISDPIVDDIPKDISCKGQEKVQQNFRGEKFPKQSDGRSFQPTWIDKFEWIEYSKQIDKVFCYQCRQFGKQTNDVFITGGFNGWKRALSSGQGFLKHESSELHIQSMASWNEKQTRTKTDQSISNLLSTNVLEKRRYYFKAIVEAIFFLVSNELPFRGSWDSDENSESGLFNSLFDYTMQKDKYLQECQYAMPANATYKSPQIQNELIKIIADELRKKIVAEINESSYITLMADGAKDKSGIELISIAFRYVIHGVPNETLIAIEKTDDLTANGLSKIIIESIEKYGIKAEKIISQCYDGAHVMSGHEGGVQKLLEKHYNRPIPYVHCFNHKLHLVVEAVVLKVNACRLFFGEVRLVHDFFNRFKVKQIYSGTNIPRLLEQRWSGHSDAVKAIRKNYFEIVGTLEKIKSKNYGNFDPVDIALGNGILKSIKKPKFIFMLHFYNGLFGALEPVNKILQMRHIGFRTAMPVIEAVCETIQHFRSDESFDSFLKEAKETFQTQVENQNPPNSSRIRRLSTRLSDSIVTETLGQNQSENDKSALKAEYLEVIDYVLSELERRFHNNSNILTAISDLNNISADDFDKTMLAPLMDIGLTLPSDSELNVVRKFIDNETKKAQNQKVGILKLLSPVKEAFPATYRMFEAYETFGSSTAVNECSFSAVGRIDTMRRMCMNDERLRNLSVLAFEKKRLTAISEEDIMHKFAEKNRKIQLF